MITDTCHLELLRLSMKQKGIDVYITAVSDPHLNEYIPEHWQIVRWLTGFDGSNATVVVTDSFAGLWTDTRYFVQADKQLEGSGFTNMRSAKVTGENYIEWLNENISFGSKMAFDRRIISISNYRKLEAGLHGKETAFITDCDLIGEIWTDRPQLPLTQAFDHPAEFSGKDRSVKIKELRQQMKKKNADYHLLTSPDDIMWLLNIRAKDLPYAPLLLSFAITGEEQVLFFAGENSIPEYLAEEFDKLGIVVLPYEEVSAMLSTLPKGSSILISPQKTSAALFFSLKEGVIILEDTSIPSRLKAIKNRTETENIDKVMIMDGVALTKFFFWIESSLKQIPMTEISLAGRLLKYRSENKEFLGPSFAPMIAFNEHAALPHYSATSETDILIQDEGILLVDSGGHYFGGTTDITRTIVLGEPSAQQIRDFTLILKGHINLARAKFPLGTCGFQLDTLARKFLWDYGLNYGHGTGHGVGYCLNVHEGPQNISPAPVKVSIEPGMLISNEPAIYREGEYGIRTENLILCYEDEETDFGQFLRFDTVTLCYIDKVLIDRSLLEQEEIEWLNTYHKEVYEKLSPYLNKEEKNWLNNKTEPI